MRKKRSVEQDIKDFLELWDCKLSQRYHLPSFELYDVDDENDWVKDTTGMMLTFFLYQI